MSSLLHEQERLREPGWRDVFALNERYEGVWQIYETKRHVDGGLIMTVPADDRTFTEKAVAEHEADRLWRERLCRVQAEAPADFLDVYGAYLAGEAATKGRVLALIDRELRHVRLADGQLGDVLRALRKDVEEGVEAPQVHPDASLLDRIDQHGHEDRAAAEEA